MRVHNNDAGSDDGYDYKHNVMNIIYSPYMIGLTHEFEMANNSKAL